MDNPLCCCYIATERDDYILRCVLALPEYMVNVIYLTSDLMFSSRVSVIARQLGINLFVVGSREKASELFSTNPAQAFIVDLENRDANSSDVAACVNHCEPRPTVIAYGPHVKEPLLAAARDQGLDHVLSRGQFDQQIGLILKSLLPPS